MFRVLVRWGFLIAMALLWGSVLPQVNPDASRFYFWRCESDIDFVAAHVFVVLDRFAGTGGLPLGPNNVWLPRYTWLSSTVALGRSASTLPPGIRIDRNTAISRRPLVHCLLHRKTSAVRVEDLCSILVPRGSFPGVAAGLVGRPLGPAAGFLSQQWIISPRPQPPSPEPQTPKATQPHNPIDDGETHTNPRSIAGMSRFLETADTWS